MLAEPYRLGPSQRQLILGRLMGDGNLSKPVGGIEHSARFRMGHGVKQEAYLDWKVSLLENIERCRTDELQGGGLRRLPPLAELASCVTWSTTVMARST